ncbi:YgjP-like metallopeptidase domain-containing protein [Mycoplasma sp. 48589B]
MQDKNLYTIETIEINEITYTYYIRYVDNTFANYFLEDNELYIIISKSHPKLKEIIKEAVLNTELQTKYMLSSARNTFYYLGNKYEYKYKSLGLIIIRRSDNNELLTTIQCETGKENNPQYIIQVISKYIKEAFRDYMQKLTNEISSKFHSRTIPVSIKNNVKTYNGVYLYRKLKEEEEIRYNFLTYPYPVDVLTYLVSHEVVHSTSYGKDKHNKTFWGVLSSIQPDISFYKNSRNWVIKLRNK